jgi:hypothetical protein
MVSTTPVIFLLSIGADPTEAIEGLARKKKLPSPTVISMGEGNLFDSHCLSFITLIRIASP